MMLPMRLARHIPRACRQFGIEANSRRAQSAPARGASHAPAMAFGKFRKPAPPRG